MGSKADQPKQPNQASTSTNQTRADHDRDIQQDSIKLVLGYECNLVKSPDPNYRPRICNACGKKIINGSMYHCKSKGWKLHPTCSQLRPNFFSKAANRTFNLHEETDVHKRIRCYKCKRDANLSGLSYVSTDCRCRFHLPCYMQLLEEWNKNKGSNNDNLVDILEAVNASLDSCVNMLGGIQ